MKEQKQQEFIFVSPQEQLILNEINNLKLELEKHQN